MSERILKALMQLFAIIAEADNEETPEGESQKDSDSKGRDVVELFLKQQLNQEQVEEYLKLFDKFLEETHTKKGSRKKRTSVNSVKVLKICTQINEELTQKQKVVVLVRLLEFVNSDAGMTPQESEFVTTVASTFNIEDEEFSRVLDFVKSSADELPESSKLLTIDNKPNPSHPSVKHIYSENLEGQLRVLNISSVNIYIFRYFGNAELNLNGQLLQRDRIYVLTQGSSIRSSKVNPIYYSDIIGKFLSDTTKSKIVFTSKEVEFQFKGGKIGLHDFNFAEESGKLIGIMGGSGAGKSTLLNVLNGNEKPSSGEVCINGINIHNEPQQIEGVIGYVSQDDLLIEELTVFQNLFYNAKLCFGNHDDEKITQLVYDMLNSLGLYEAKDLKVGSPLEKIISGGQRKRLNIALELIREPSVLFVDEPTSGLSSRDSENIMDLLKELALKGKLVIVVIHQPSSEIFKMFDKLLLLDVGGYPIYNGNPVDAVIYFKTLVNHVNSNESECPKCGNVNPEQIFNIIESKVLDEYGNLTNNRKTSPREWNEHYKERIDGKVDFPADEVDIPESTFSIPNKFKQFRVFLTRDVLSKLTNTQYLLINLLEAPLLAFILAYLTKFYNSGSSESVGYIFRENENMPAYLFMSVIVALFIGLTVSAEEIIKDRKILKRESFLNLSRSSYLYSKVSIMFVLSAIQTLTFVLIGNWILEIKGMGINYWLVLFTTSCFANMLGLNISAAFNSAVTIYILIPFLLIPQLLLSGVIVKFDKLNPGITNGTKIPLIGEMMTSRWAFEAISVNQFKNNEFESQFYEYDKVMSNSDFKKNYWIPTIRAKVDKSENLYRNPEEAQIVRADLDLIRNEIKNEMRRSDVSFALADSIRLESFNPTLAAKVKDHLAHVNKFYIRQYNSASRAKDSEVSKQNKDEEAREDYILRKNKYQNESLSELVKNTTEIDKIVEINGRLIQKADPIYLDPESTFLQAHFFAPRKKIFGKFYDTFWVNVSVIWAISILLYITLYFDLFRRLLDTLENLYTRVFPSTRR